MGAYGMFGPNEYLLSTGRLATGFGLFGLALGLILSIPTGTDALSIIAVTVIFGYLGVTGFWGAYNIDRWFRKYRYRMPKPAWYVLRVLFIILGIIGGALGYGAIEHFILLLAMDAPLGLFGAQLILLPFAGRKLGQLMKYNPATADPFRDHIDLE